MMKSPKRSRKTDPTEEQELQRKLDFTAVLASKPLQKPVYTVAEITALIEEAFSEHDVLGGSVVVQGELSNLKQSARGHVYFTLKDGEAAINGILWASTVARLNFDLEDGQEVYLTGKLEVYWPNGTYSIVASKIEPVGIGALQLAFQQLKARLEAEGLFMEEFKKSLPAFPERIGIITSNTGAVIHDMLRVIRRKNPLVDVLLAPVKVQGDGACHDIARAIRELNHPAYGLDLLIVGRGGGSYEDLFCFSEEPVVRAIFESEIPVVTGIGHEPDFSLADAAADYSASTPTAAAEIAVPDVHQILETHQYQAELLLECMRDVLLAHEQRLDHSATRLMETFGQRLTAEEHQTRQRAERLAGQCQLSLQRFAQRLGEAAASLEAFNPVKTLARGFSVATKADGTVISSVNDTRPGEALVLRVTDGTLACRVESIQEEKPS